MSRVTIKSPWTLLARGKQFALIGLDDGRIEIQPLPLVDAFRLGVGEPEHARDWEHHFIRAVDIGGEKLTVKDSIGLQLYRYACGGETLECGCAFDEIEKVWYVKQ